MKKRSSSSPEQNFPGAPKQFVVPFLLLQLRDFNLHGYQLIEQLIKLGFHSIDRGNIYRILRQLEKDHLISSQWDTSSEGPARRIYSLTEAGEAYLQSWAASLELYQHMLETFFSLYKKMFVSPSNENEYSKGERS
ncbi:PadR family transcriptional regulator [Thermolongibacillus altinsuensis]|jgi:PadR family transcriptional regulator PadR|uniref:PadR family transcriptional regulator n=1 Tax=Thermolongibacillus altinsuensis TaxID=575256 RepID=A0A4R1QDZ5_9BACL|nr:poly-beta-hydroxybutyrate-responsive repressor [Thermolongibacillus altinsuensis]TCL49289.1 PadR family transcriptional regulator [Thermolongibacillus altinsuensis]GMB10115.1 poly-beta-hydroxybutyrate-responsive repressor [Thermolongibacillus altinsuensis]